MLFVYKFFGNHVSLFFVLFDVGIYNFADSIIEYVIFCIHEVWIS